MMERRKVGKGSPKGVEDWKRDMRALLPQINDAVALAQAVTEIQEELEVVIYEAVLQLRSEGFSYAELADAFGMSRQGARWRWPDPGVDPGAYRRPAEAPRRRRLPVERLAEAKVARPIPRPRPARREAG